MCNLKELGSSDIGAPACSSRACVVRKFGTPRSPSFRIYIVVPTLDSCTTEIIVHHGTTPMKNQHRSVSAALVLKA